MADEWAYTNAEHTEGRKGRWTCGRKSNNAVVAKHDDFPDTEWVESIVWPGKNDRRKAHHRVAGEQIDSFLAWHAAQPAPIAVGDYVRLKGERWGEHMGKVVRVVRAESETEYAAVKIDGSVWYVTPNWTAERLTVTADLDEPWNLPMPEVGEWVWVERADQYECFVGRVSEIAGDGRVYVNGHHVGSIGTKYTGVIAWGTYDPADLAPDEPTTFGYVGYVTDADGDVWDVVLDGDTYKPFSLVNRTTGKFESRYWSDVLALGTFAAVER